jgi:DNA processing protein
MQLSFSAPNATPDLDTPKQRRALIALSLVSGIGPGRLRALLAAFQTPVAVMNAPLHALKRVDGIGTQTAKAVRAFDDYATVEAEMERAARMNAMLITPWSERFPERLRHIYDPPAFLWMRGSLLPADARAVAIVGTRRCTDHGRAQAHRFAGELVRHGFTIVSGLAYGIDAAAHKGALDAGGRTLAVLGSGLGRIYPQKHTRLAARAADHGAVLSEYGLTAKPDASNFPERNRIVSGLTLGTLVVESHSEGGALITARMAVEQNREVFALPGNLGKDASVGTNHLIQRGHAKLVMTVEDILEELPVPAQASTASPDADASSSTPDPAASLEGDARILYDALTDTPVHIDHLCVETGVSPSAALTALLELEFSGLVRQLAGKQFRRM